MTQYSPQEVPTAQRMVLGVPVHDVEAQAFGDLALALGHEGLHADGRHPVLLLQATQGQASVYGLEDDGANHLGHGLPVAHVVANQGGDTVEALPFKEVLHPGVGLVHGHHLLVDLEVLRGVLPLAGQHIVPWAGQGVPDQEVPIPLDQVLCHL